MNFKKLNNINYFLILIISLFYSTFYLNLDYTIVGVIKELVLLPSILGQLGISIYFVVKIFRSKLKLVSN